MRDKKVKIGTVSLALFLTIAMVFLPAANAFSSNGLYKNFDEDLIYTDSELQQLYVKYDIKENDIKFAKGEMPNFLAGTILDGNKKVLVVEDGKALEEKYKNYDIIISESEMLDIVNKAKLEYFEKYGVDTSNPKLDDVDGKLIPTEELKQLAKDGKIQKYERVSIVRENILRDSWNPKQINGCINVHVYPATDSYHRPSESYQQDTIDAIRRFDSFGIQTNIVWHYEIWDASNVNPADDANNTILDLRNDCSYIRSDDNDIVLGWVNYLNHNGIAYIDGPFSLCAVKAAGLDWPHDSIVQHEVSHNFGADDQNSISHPTCIMKYLSAYLGTDIWCNSCRSTVNYGINY